MQNRRRQAPVRNKRKNFSQDYLAEDASAFDTTNWIDWMRGQKSACLQLRPFKLKPLKPTPTGNPIKLARDMELDWDKQGPSTECLISIIPAQTSNCTELGARDTIQPPFAFDFYDTPLEQLNLSEQKWFTTANFQNRRCLFCQKLASFQNACSLSHYSYISTRSRQIIGPTIFSGARLFVDVVGEKDLGSAEYLIILGKDAISYHNAEW